MNDKLILDIKSELKNKSDQEKMQFLHNIINWCNNQHSILANKLNTAPIERIK